MADTCRTHVILTDKIKRCIRMVLTKENLPDSTRQELLKYSSGRRSVGSRNGRTIPFELVKTVHELMNNRPGQSEGQSYLHELLEGAEIHLPEYEPPPRNPELEARVQKLKAEQENKEYKEMTRNVDLGKSKKNEYASFGADVKSLNSQLVAVFNFLVTVAGAFTFGYKSVEFTVDTPNIPMQMCAGLICATIVFFADLYFLLKHTS